MLTKERFEEYKKIYKEEFGEEKLKSKTDEQLFEEATKLINLMEVVYKHQNSIENQHKVDKAYDILFDEVVKSRYEQNK